MAPAPQSFENRDGAIGIQTVGEEIQPEALRGDGFGGTWPGEGGARVPAFLLHRQAGTVRRDDSLAACSPGGRFRRFTPRGVSFTAGRGPRGGVMVWQHADREAASPRFTPRGLLRWREARGALRVLFFLGVSPPAKKSTQKRSQALLFFRGGQPPIGQKQP